VPPQAGQAAGLSDMVTPDAWLSMPSS